MNEEKALTRIDSEYEKALAERDKLQAELDRLTKKEMQDKHHRQAPHPEVPLQSAKHGNNPLHQFPPMSGSWR